MRTLRSPFLQKLALAACLGFLIGKFAGPTLEAQASRMLFGSNSATGTSQVIQTDGSNALEVIGK